MYGNSHSPVPQHSSHPLEAPEAWRNPCVAPPPRRGHETYLDRHLAAIRQGSGVGETPGNSSLGWLRLPRFGKRYRCLPEESEERKMVGWPGAGGDLRRLDGGWENLSWWLVSKKGLHKGRFDDKQWKSIAGSVSPGQLKCWGCISSQNKCTEISYSHYPNNSCMAAWYLYPHLVYKLYKWSRSPLPEAIYQICRDDANEILY